MRLYLVHQGLTLSDKENIKEPLSDEGRISLQRSASFIARSRFAVSKVFHSNKLCAKQTAIILSQGLGAGRLVQDCPVPIEAHDKVQPLHQLVEGGPNDAFGDSSLVVSDKQFLERFLSYLMCENERCLLVNFEPGTFVALEASNTRDQWRIQWVLKPDLLGV